MEPILNKWLFIMPTAITQMLLADMVLGFRSPRPAR